LTDIVLCASHKADKGYPTNETGIIQKVNLPIQIMQDTSPARNLGLKRLHEYCAKLQLPAPEWEDIKPDDNGCYQATVTVNGEKFVGQKCDSDKDARRDAASKAVDFLEARNIQTLKIPHSPATTHENQNTYTFALLQNNCEEAEKKSMLKIQEPANVNGTKKKNIYKGTTYASECVS